MSAPYKLQQKMTFSLKDTGFITENCQQRSGGEEGFFFFNER